MKDNPDDRSIDLSNEPFYLLKHMHSFFYKLTYDSSEDAEMILSLHIDMHELADRYGCQALKVTAFQNLETALKKPSANLNTRDLITTIRKIEAKSVQNEQKYDELRTLLIKAGKEHLTKLLSNEENEFSQLLVDFPGWTLSFLRFLDDTRNADPLGGLRFDAEALW